MKLILASTSKYRKALLARVGIDVDTFKPDYDERPVEGLSARELVEHHGVQKTKAVVDSLATEALSKNCALDDDLYVIGSDQGLIFQEQLVGKPGSVEKAVEQLKAFRGKTCDLVTSLCVMHAASRKSWTRVDVTTLVFANLTDEALHTYVEADMPIDCAGSFKIESRGPILFEAIHTDDPTAIEGLPVMALCSILRDLEA